MAETNRKMNSKIETLQYVATDASIVEQGSPEDSARRALTLSTIDAQLGHDWKLADALRRYLSLAGRYHRKSLNGGLNEKQWAKLNRIALALDDALDEVEETLKMDILIGDVEETKGRPALRGASRTDANKKGEVALYYADFEALLLGTFTPTRCPHCGK